MNVAIFASAFYPHLGGVEELCRQLAAEYARRDVGVLVLTNRWPRKLPAHSLVEGIEVLRLPFRLPSGSFKSWAMYHLTTGPVRLQLAAALSDRKIDLLHVQCVNASTAYAVHAARKLKLPLVVTTQGERTMDANGLFQKSARMNGVFRDALSAEVVTACSADTLADVRTHFGFAGGRVVYNGVRVADFQGEAVPAEKPFVLAIGRHVRQKGFDVLLRAWALAGVSSHELVLAGDGPERPALEKLAAGLNLRVRFFGPADRPAAVRLFRACSFFVLPSRTEPLGIVNLEAMAAGKAVVASRTGGVPELVEDGRTGLLVPPDDVATLASAVAELANNPRRRDAMGAAGKERAGAFDWAKIADQYLAIYSELVK